MGLIVNTYRWFYRALKDVVWNVSFYVCELIFLAGGSARIKVSPVNLQRRLYQLNRSALNSPALSERTLIYLKDWDLLNLWRRKPLEVLQEINRRLDEYHEPAALFVLIELCYLFADLRSKFSLSSIQMYASCCRYAYICLFDPQYREKINPYRKEFQMACDFYNRSLSILLQYIFQKPSRLNRAIKIPVLDGSITINCWLDAFPWSLEMVKEIRVANEYVLRGLYNYMKVPGLGVPIFVVRKPVDSQDVPIEETYMPRNIQIFSLTALLQISTDTEQEITGASQLRFYDPLKIDSVDINNDSIALAKDIATPVGYLISSAPLPTGFESMLKIKETAHYQDLHMLQPYDKDKIPVVLVHGLMATPLTWLSMVNYFLNDPVIRSKYQFWFYMYSTGNPILYSSLQLREKLVEVQQLYDPDKSNPAFNQMVVVAHSMGGIVSKMLVQSSGNELWQSISDAPLDEVGFLPEHETLLRNLFFYEPLPFIKRMIFVATPHRGAKFSQRPIGRIGAFSVKMQQDILVMCNEMKRVLGKRHTKNKEIMEYSRRIKRIPTGIDGLRPDNPLFSIISGKPISPDVAYHSIIGNCEADDTPGGTDRIVPYESSHIDGAASEVIVKSSHGVHCRPRTFLEIQRILNKHLQR